MDKQAVILSRDIFALLVPSGARVMLHQGTEVILTQALGNSFTVNAYGNLARIEGKDADALGQEVHSPLDDLPPNASMEDKVEAQLRTVFDPEIPVNIVDLGLIYRTEAKQQANGNFIVELDMTLTAPGCGMGPVITEDAHNKILNIPEVEEVVVEMVFDPPWDRSMMSEEAQLELGIF
jgi:probable FeS assembly SUF system protein SufT